MKTSYVENYKGVTVTVTKDGRAHADYPNTPAVARKISQRTSRTKRILKSDPKRHRVYYPKGVLGEVFTDIDAVM